MNIDNSTNLPPLPDYDNLPRLPDAARANVDSPPAVSEGPADGAGAESQNIIDEKLNNWARNPGGLADDGVDAPSLEIIQRAIAFAKSSQARKEPAPTSVVPDPNGGIVFERRRQDESEVVHFWDDGSVEYFLFKGQRLVTRRPATKK